MLVTRFILAFALGTLAGSTELFAQDSGVQPGNNAFVQLVEPHQPVVTVKFTGGPVSAYIAALKAAAAPEPVNVVASKYALEIPIGGIELTSVTLETALEAIEAAADSSKYGWSIHAIHKKNAASPPGVSISGAFAVDAMVRGQSASPSRTAEDDQTSHLQVFSIRDITDSRPGDAPGVSFTYSPDVVLSAIQAGLASANASDAEIKFHADSGLVITRGNAQQTEIVQETIRQMVNDVKKRREAAMGAGMTESATADLRADVAKAHVMFEAAARELQMREAQRSDVVELVAAGSVSREDLRQAEAEALRARSQLELAQIEVARFEELMKARAEAADRRTADAAAPTVRIYDFRDFGDNTQRVMQRISELSKAVTQYSGLPQPMSVVEARDGSLTIRGYRWAHDMVSQVLDAARAEKRAKAEDPAR